jgi:ATP-dependent Clp protease ATP-binding subunit ClpC
MNYIPLLVPVVLPDHSMLPTCLSPHLSRGEIQCIGATTLDEYRQYIEKDGALARRFQMVMVDSTTVDETIQILENIKEKYEDHHHVLIQKKLLKPV